MKEEILRDAAHATPDPERSLKNLLSFVKENPSTAGELEQNLRPVSLLFSISQFLANYCIANPDALFASLSELDFPQNENELNSALGKLLDGKGEAAPRPRSLAQKNLEPYMTAVREFKTRQTLKITLRDIMGKADLIEVMLELSALADVILDNSLRIVKRSLDEIYGEPTQAAFSVIALGKLGGGELNFSSDVDLIYVYGTEIGETSGVITGHGISSNKISSHEYYCKLGESLTRFLSLNTESGFAYRVDLRLRPEGQRGDIALALRGYEMYYESWGRAWERAMLIRARPAAGDRKLGERFVETIKPFVYRKYLDFSSIDEIRSLKTRIDSTFKKSDIKRGYGGIREIEFFAQALQLIYGGKEPLLRERSVLKALHRLLQKALIGQEDYFILSENYRYFRTLEHRLQQINDLQTHTIPANEEELQILGRKMGLTEPQDFAGDLQQRREGVRNIYDSLFSERHKQDSARQTFFDEELSDAELRDYLSNTGVKDIGRAARNIRSIKESTSVFQTLRGRRLLGAILPAFVESALKSSSPDAALNNLQSFANLLSLNEPYLEIFSRDNRLIDLLTYVFSQSEYLSKMMMARPRYLEMLGLQQTLKKSRAALIEDINSEISEGHGINEAVRLLKQSEEIRLGFLFLQKRIGALEVMKGLSKTAEAILSACIRHFSDLAATVSLIGFGKLGGREITFNSDLDLIFVSSGDVRESETKSAERVLRMLISYTREGIAYRVDTRLRPDGSKGPLVSSVESFRKYYSSAAAFWEFQALLKARPVAGHIKTGESFLAMAKDILASRGREIPAAEITKMRSRIVKELAKETEGFDIKLGPGGIEEIEFAVQFLQLKNCGKHAGLLVQGTLKALDRFSDGGIIAGGDAGFLKEAYLFYRTLESFIRLRGEDILKKEDHRMKNAAEFMGFAGPDELIGALEGKRQGVRRFFEKNVVD